jgi:hypothetical protein
MEVSVLFLPKSTCIDYAYGIKSNHTALLCSRLDGTLERSGDLGRDGRVDSGAGSNQQKGALDGKANFPLFPTLCYPCLVRTGTLMATRSSIGVAHSYHVIRPTSDRYGVRGS